MPNGATIWPSQMAGNLEGCVGVPAGVLIDAGFRVYDQWLCEVQDNKVVRAVVRVLGPACALEEKPHSNYPNTPTAALARAAIINPSPARHE